MKVLLNANNLASQ